MNANRAGREVAKAELPSLCETARGRLMSCSGGDDTESLGKRIACLVACLAENGTIVDEGMGRVMRMGACMRMRKG